MSLKAQTHFNTICNVRMRLRHCPPISVLTTPYAFTPPPLPSLCSCGALPTCSRHHLSLRLWSALPTCS
ncbi:hypothetical protein O181_113411 [Austropuccinia psidii MF-1]|uniref:Uncharacterized protein n=1 Tax=Austropuccinia psidii MF-1 TaxID=1389203 RepID=A0A9Q3PUE9_9BASI|nr:hypothetical protein [Austropuccinia psidii MF-1]